MKPACMILLMGTMLAASTFAFDQRPAAPAEQDSPQEFRLLSRPLAKKETAKPSRKRAAKEPEEKREQPSIADEAREAVDLFQTLASGLGLLAGNEVNAAKQEVPKDDGLEQQFLPQFRPLMQTELRFVRSVCQPNPEQYRLIKADGETALKSAVRKFAGVQRQMQQGMRPGQTPDWPDPRAVIADALSRSVMQKLPPEQARRYLDEIEKRTAARQRAAVLSIVAKLDNDLVLTAEQREQLIKALTANGKKSWGAQLEVFHYGPEFVPVAPTNLVSPILNEKQRQAWQGMAKNQEAIWGWFGFGIVSPVAIDDEELSGQEDLDDLFPTKKQDVAQKKDD